MNHVLTGLDRWLAGAARPAALGRGARVGLVVHAASVRSDARHLLEALDREGPVRVERIFAPEHGLWGHEQDMEAVADARDPISGRPVVSLYGKDEASLRPAARELADLDALVCDLQDVGSRYYTFVYTIAHVMEAAREADLPVVVLDRPNPIGGDRVEGPVLHPELRSFVGRYPIPPRHGMTVGELARLFNERFGIRCELEVIPLEGWNRSMEFDATGLPWVPPSPNMPTVDTARVYPGACLLEGTNLSEGRGTTTPFEVLGAPWLDPVPLAAALRSCGLPGVEFRATSFRPMFQKHAGRGCGGVQVLVRDRRRAQPFRTYWEILRATREQDPRGFRWRREAYEFVEDRPAIDLLLGRSDLRPLLEEGASHEDVEPLWRQELEEFLRLREEYLIY